MSCNCIGPSTAAKVPVKRYNLLVPAIYPVTEPNYAKPVGISVEKNIKRLLEYLERNEHRIPKVSRRLARNLHSDLSRGKLGYVRISTTAYQQLITANNGQYARLYTKELIVKYPKKKRHLWTLGAGPAVSRLPAGSSHLGTVVGALINSSHPPAQQWGLQLLITLLKQQQTAEFMTNFEALVPLLCSKATSYITATLHSNESSQVLSAYDGFDMNPIPSLSLQALLEHLRLCFRLSYVSIHLETITYAVLNIVEIEGQATGASYASSTDYIKSRTNPLILSKQSIGAAVGSASPGLAALLVYEELGRMTRDAAEGKKVLEFLFKFLDQKPERWLGGSAREFGLGIMRDSCSHEHQRFLLASGLIHHAGLASSLGPLQSKVVVEESMKDVMALDQSTIPSALLLSLQELPKAMSRVGDENSEKKEFQETVRVAVHLLASRIGNRLQLTAVLGAILSRLTGPTHPTATATLRCCVAASQVYPTLLTAPGGPAHHLSNILLRSLLGLCLEWKPDQRVLAHTIIQNALRSVSPLTMASYPSQVELILSCVWHEVALPDSNPDCYAAMTDTVTALLEVLGDRGDLMDLCRFVACVQGDVVTGERFAKLHSTKKMSTLAFCASMWTRIAEKMKLQSLKKLAIVWTDADRPQEDENHGADEDAVWWKGLAQDSEKTTQQGLLRSLDKLMERKLGTTVPFVPLSKSSISLPVSLALVPSGLASSVPPGQLLPVSPRAQRLQAAFSTNSTSSTSNGGVSTSDVAVAGSNRMYDGDSTEVTQLSDSATTASVTDAGGVMPMTTKLDANHVVDDHEFKHKHKAANLDEVLSIVEAALNRNFNVKPDILKR